jgi:thioredoxin 1
MSENSKLKTVSDDSFETDVLKSPKPSIVDFWAEWCGPCKMIAPVFEELAGEYSDKVNFYKMNVEENSGTPAKFQISGIPTMIIFKDGKEFDRIVGAVPKENIAEILSKAL